MRKRERKKSLVLRVLNLFALFNTILRNKHDGNAMGSAVIYLISFTTALKRVVKKCKAFQQIKKQFAETKMPSL